jgi:predicted DnaQ family exonuclease/DinG family helicase
MSVDDAVILALRLSGAASDSASVYELAALRGREGAEPDRLVTFVHTPEPLPYHVRILAGIEPADLVGTPEPAEVASQLARFARDLPLVLAGGAPAAAALARLAPRLQSPVFDLSELAELLNPGLASYDVPALAAHFELPPCLSARAEPEAALAAAVYARLAAQARSCDPLLLHEIIQLTGASPWPLRYFFRDLGEGEPSPLQAIEGLLSALPLTQDLPGQALTPNSTRRHIEPDEVVDTLACAVAADALSGFEPRPEQCAMAAAVASALDADEKLIVEAGTGTGKSLAYLLPSALFALRNNARVVVSTNTINLQEQIVGKDVPALRRLLEDCGPLDVRERAAGLRCVPLKGRRNYLCMQRLALLRRMPAQTEPEARFLARVLLWLPQSRSGDRAELRLRPEEEPLWNRISAEGSNCFNANNSFIRNGTCQLLQARKRAEASHLVVVNHALLLADLASGGRAMPAYDRLIVDEAHNLEDEATNQFGFHAGQGDIVSFLDSVFSRARERESGLVTDLRTAMHAAATPVAQENFLAEVMAKLVEHVEHARERVPETFGRLRGFVQQHGGANGDYDNRLLLTPAKRAQPEWMQVELAWENLRLALLQVEDGLSRLGVAIADCGAQGGILAYEELLGSVETLQLGGRLLRQGIEAIIDRHDTERIAWITVNRANGSVGFSSAPLIVGEVLDSYLFSRKASVVLTSATLSAGGSFDYVRERLGLEDSRELALGSPFDYERAALLLLPADVPEPSHPQYQRALEEALVELCAASRGRALVLFTSHSALRATYYAIRARLAAVGVRTLAQGIDGTPPELLAALRREGQTVLFGTASFWEGVDVVGEALSLLVIAKLPFSVPSDPVFTARAELFDEPFRDFALPQAILRFKQGFGRLIRHRGDRGVVAVLDRRLRSKAYGRTFLQSLPGCTTRELPTAELGSAVRDWLGIDAPPRVAEPAPARRARRC